MWFQAVVRTSFDSDSNAFCATLLAKLDGLGHSRRVMTGQCIVQITDKEVLHSFDMKINVIILIVFVPCNLRPKT